MRTAPARGSLRRTATALISIALASVAFAAAATPAAAAPGPDTLDLGTYLTGKQEVPKNSGDPDATGIALLTLYRNGRLCYVVRVRNVTGDITAAHIHEGLPGRDGPVAAPLAVPSWFGSVAMCTDIGAKLAKRIWAAPHRYYLNVHSSTHPDGALRGQLHHA
jgi:hypothetical protein